MYSLCVVSFLLFKRMKQRMKRRRDPKTPNNTEATEGIEGIHSSPGETSQREIIITRKRKEREKEGKKGR